MDPYLEDFSTRIVQHGFQFSKHRQFSYLTACMPAYPDIINARQRLNSTGRFSDTYVQNYRGL